jgi:hypothetical protein
MARFFTVQSGKDAIRLSVGGAPWPKGLKRANLGQGLYAWELYQDADAYRQLLMTHGAKDLIVLTYEINDNDLAKLLSFDLTKLGDDDVNAWMAQFSQYGQGRPHGFEHVMRNTDRGKEHYFAANVFTTFKEVP